MRERSLHDLDIFKARRLITVGLMQISPNLDVSVPTLRGWFHPFAVLSFYFFIF